jgi:hypothetical protein
MIVAIRNPVNHWFFLFFRSDVPLHGFLLLLLDGAVHGDKDLPEVGGHSCHLQGEDGFCHSQCDTGRHQGQQVYFHHLRTAGLHLFHSE